MLKLLDPYRWMFVAGFVALVLAGYYWHRNSLIEQGRAEVRAEWNGYNNDRLREQIRETSRLTGIVSNINEAHHETLQTLDAAERRLAAADSQRLQLNKAKRDAAIASASAETLRVYASTAADVYGECRTEYRALGFEAGRCAATAQTLNDYSTTLLDSWTALSEFNNRLDSFKAKLKGTP